MAEYEGDWKLTKFQRAAANGQYTLCQNQRWLPTSVVGLHSLQSVAEHSPAVNLDLTLLGDDRALDAAPGPEVVVHAAPWLLGVCAVVAGAGLSALEAGSGSGELDVDQAAVVDCCLDRVCRAVLVQLDGNAVGVEGVVSLIEAVVRQRITRPKEGLLVVGVEDFGVELHRCARAEDVIVDDLEEANVTRIRVEVEGLRLDVGVVESLPLEVLLGQLGVRRVACILANRLDGFRAVDGLLGTGDRGQPVNVSIHISCSVRTSSLVSRITRGRYGEGFTHADLAQLNIVRDERGTIQKHGVSDWW